MKTVVSFALAMGLIAGSTGAFACPWQKSASKEGSTTVASTPVIEEEGMSTFDPGQINPDQTKGDKTLDGKTVED